MTSLWLIVSLLHTNVAARASDSMFGFARELHHTHIPLGKNKDATGEVEFDCWDYGGWALAQISDPALVGAKELEIRRYASPVAACARDYKGKRDKITYANGFFAGASGPFAFFDATNSFGALFDFVVYDVRTAKQVFSATRFTFESIELHPEHGKTVLRFTLALEIPCPLLKEGQSCWTKTLAANHVPPTVSLAAPDCKLAAGSEPQIGTDVSVDDLTHPSIRFLGGKTYCVAAPTLDAQ